MRKLMRNATLLAGVAMCLAVFGAQNAEAGLFDFLLKRNKNCCAPAPSCHKPVVVHCAKPAPKPTCHKPAPTCCKPAPTCCAPKPSCAKPHHAPKAPKAADAPPAPKKEKTLYDRLGGEAAIKAVVAKFVGRAATNPKVNFFRKGTDKEWKPGEGDVAKLQKDLVDFVGSATGGPQEYKGRSMKEIHKGMKITKAEFGAIAGDLIATLKEFKVPQKEIDELIAIVGTTASDIVEE